MSITKDASVKWLKVNHPRKMGNKGIATLRRRKGGRSKLTQVNEPTALTNKINPSQSHSNVVRRSAKIEHRWLRPIPNILKFSRYHPLPPKSFLPSISTAQLKITPLLNISQKWLLDAGNFNNNQIHEVYWDHDLEGLCSTKPQRHYAKYWAKWQKHEYKAI